ncbi:MAG: CcoQ/FixQ family Cbb3-type cytochrome c oxidase assembly chaperone [Polaromonas sp.]|nr:CcoQ/FixQ family Cbb3-type cytochrome c oxidase assembly chaperone [Polaromonas sp.]
MDINDMRSVVTLVSFLTFVGIIAWAWSKRNKSDFDEAARLPFKDE